MPMSSKYSTSSIEGVHKNGEVLNLLTYHFKSITKKYDTPYIDRIAKIEVKKVSI